MSLNFYSDFRPVIHILPLSFKTQAVIFSFSLPSCLYLIIHEKKGLSKYTFLWIRLSYFLPEYDICHHNHLFLFLSSMCGKKNSWINGYIKCNPAYTGWSYILTKTCTIDWYILIMYTKKLSFIGIKWTQCTVGAIHDSLKLATTLNTLHG